MLRVGTSVLHQHAHEVKPAFSCEDCHHNKVHSGHLLSWDGWNDDCSLCQQLLTPYTECPLFDEAIPSMVFLCRYLSPSYDVVECDRGTPLLRGPPSFLL